MVKGITLGVVTSMLTIGCGGGGGGGDNVDVDLCLSVSCINYVNDQAEYLAQDGLNNIDAANANLASATGENIRIAVVDSGIDSSHTEFNQRTILGSDFASSSGGYGTDDHGHGTHVAGIIAARKNNYGMRGVAYAAQLYSYRVANDAGSLTALNTDAGRASVYQQHVSDNIQISNNSWGSSTNILNYDEATLRTTDALSIAAMRSAQENGTIFVFAANNDYQDQVSKEAGLPYYINELAAQFLAVMAIDTDLKETGFTNRCGVAADFCLAAPGNNIRSAQTGGGHTEKSGTSMAAPHVSGVLALVTGHFPSLSASEVVSRVKATASLDGLTGYFGCTLASCGESAMRTIFGHGLVNAEAAVSPIGSLFYTADGSTDQPSAAALRLPNGFGQAFSHWVANLDVAMFDRFDGAQFMRKGSDVFASKAEGTMALIAYSPSQNKGTDFATDFGHYSQSHSLGSTAYPVYFSSSARAMNLASANFWGDLSGLLIQPSFIPNQLHDQIEMPFYQGESLSLRPFMQFTKNTQTKVTGFGFNLLWQNKDTHLLTSLSSSKHNLNLGVSKAYEQNQQQIQNIELGLQQRFSPSTLFFLRTTYSQLSTHHASTQQWGLKKANLMQFSSGLEIKHKTIKIALGLYDPGHFTNGEISLLVAKGITKNKQIYYEKESFKLKAERRLAGFLAAKGRLMLSHKQAIDVSLSVQQSPYKKTHVGQASLTAAFNF